MSNKKNRLIREFLQSEKTAGVLLIFCSVISIILSNSRVGEAYSHFWHSEIGSRSIEFWINDGLMTVFFLLVGLEIEREFYKGELSSFRQAMLPVFAALGGMLVPASIHALLNHGTEAQRGFGIPMATDIAFSLAVLSLLGNRVPITLKIFLTALAIIDDLGAILVIAVFYSKELSFIDLGVALGIFGFMLILNRLKVHRLLVYLPLGLVMWFFMQRSGIHATISGVLLAFALPFGDGESKSPSYILQERLHGWVALLILPLFALANTAIAINFGGVDELLTNNNLGIILGLLVGKPVGIFLFSVTCVALGLCHLPAELKKGRLFWLSCLGGIGFTMSIFITLLAFSDSALINSSKVAIILGSVVSAIIGYIGLKFSLNRHGMKNNPNRTK